MHAKRTLEEDMREAAERTQPMGMEEMLQIMAEHQAECGHGPREAADNAHGPGMPPNPDESTDRPPPDGAAQAPEPVEDTPKKAKRPRRTRPVWVPTVNPMEVAAKAGDLQAFMGLVDEMEYVDSHKLLFRRLRTCVANALKNNPGKAADDMLGQLIAFQYELHTRCRLRAMDDLRRTDARNGDGPAPLEDVMERHAPRLSRVQQELKELLKLQSQVRHVHGIADRDRARPEPDVSNAEPLPPTQIPEQDDASAAAV